MSRTALCISALGPWWMVLFLKLMEPSGERSSLGKVVHGYFIGGSRFLATLCFLFWQEREKSLNTWTLDLPTVCFLPCCVLAFQVGCLLSNREPRHTCSLFRFVSCQVFGESIKKATNSKLSQKPPDDWLLQVYSSQAYPFCQTYLHLNFRLKERGLVCIDLSADHCLG